MNKITEEQLKNIQEQQALLNQTFNDIGVLSTQKHALLHKIADINKEVEEQKHELEKQYGPININLETGEYTKIETEDNKPELKVVQEKEPADVK